MKIIVTGGAGFIASHITDAYIRAGHRVAIIDNLSNGFRKNLNRKAKFYKADIRNAKAVEAVFRREKPEVLNHHAAIASVIKSMKYPASVLETNTIGTANLLAAFGAHGRGKKRKFIFASTGGAMYGDPKKIPVDEKTSPEPFSVYGLSKLLAEETVHYHARMYGFDYLIFRYSNVYGPRQNPKGEAGVVAIFGALMKSSERPVIFGDGTKTRDYVYVGDVARANLLGLSRGKNVTLNIGTGKTVSDKNIFNAVAKETGFLGKPIYAPYRKGEVHRIALDASRAKRILGWKPKVPLQKGITATIEDIKC